MSKFLPTSGFTWIDPKDFDSNRYKSQSLKGCVLEVDLEYPKELRELHNDYPLASDKVAIVFKDQLCLKLAIKTPEQRQLMLFLHFYC